MERASCSADMWARVLAARDIQQRQGHYKRSSPMLLAALSALSMKPGVRTIDIAVRRMGLSAGAHDRVLKATR
jgi:hypothetical protein